MTTHRPAPAEAIAVRGGYVAASPVRRAAGTPGVAAFGFLALTWVSFAPAYWIFLVTAAIPVAVATLGLLVLQGWAREISLATAGIFCTSAYLFGYLNRQDNLGKGIPWVGAALLAIGAVTALMVVLAAVSVRLPGIYLVVLTLGLQITLERTVFTHGRLSGGMSGGTELGIPIINPRPYFFGLDLIGDTTFYFFSLAWLALILVLLVRHSPAGRAFLLVGADRQAASAVGISPLRYRLAAFAISGALAGTGGVLASWLFVSPPVFLGYMAPQSLFLLAIPVLAGRDAIAWVLAVAVAFQTIPMALESWRVNTFFLAGIGLILGALAGPRGLAGLAHDLRDRLRSRRARPAADTHRSAPTPDLDQALSVVSEWIGDIHENQSALILTDAHVRIGGITVLDDVSLDVPAGGLVGLIGPNGAGKSTLFDVVTGVRPADGRVALFGADVTDAAAWRRSRLGMTRVFQSTRVIDDLSVADNLLVGAHARIEASTAALLAGSPAAWRKAAAAEDAAYAMAQLLRIDKHWHTRAGAVEFSARRRIEVGRALLSGSRLLMLDEPAAGLDPDSAAALFALLRRLHADLGLTILLIEHNVHAVLELCDTVHVLAHGRLIASGTPAEIIEDEEVKASYLGNRLRYSAPPPVSA